MRQILSNPSAEDERKLRLISPRTGVNHATSRSARARTDVTVRHAP